MKKMNIIDNISVKMLSYISEHNAETADLLNEILSLEDINLKGRDGRTLLIHASAYGHLSIVKLLIESNADINAKDTMGYSALHAAVSAGHISVVELLLNRGADPNALDAYGNGPLFRASHQDNAIIALLLEYGANPCLKNNYGVSPYDAFQAYPQIICAFDLKQGDKCNGISAKQESN